MKQASRFSRWWVVAICIALAGITWSVFGQTLRHDFINYDDDLYVYENPNIVSGLTRPAILWAFTHAHAGTWHPLTSLSHMLDCQVYGLNAGGHHFTNVLLHTLAVVLLFLFLQQVTGAPWRSAFVAAVFAVHPLRVESVAWIAERKDVLSGVFFMLTLLAYARYVSGERSLLRYLLVAFFFALGLMAKPMLVTLPLVLLLLDYWPLCRFGSHSSGNAANFARRSIFSRLVAEKIPLFLLSLLSSLLTWWAQRAFMRSTSEIPLVLRAENAIVSYVRYLRQLLWPADLAPFYPHPQALPLLLRHRGCCSPRRHFGGSLMLWTKAPISDHRLGLVPDHALAGNRLGAGGRASAGRPFYLSAANWDRSCDHMDGRRRNCWHSAIATLRRLHRRRGNGYSRVVRLPSNPLLAKQRIHFAANAGRDREQRPGTQQSGQPCGGGVDVLMTPSVSTKPR